MINTDFIDFLIMREMILSRARNKPTVYRLIRDAVAVHRAQNVESAYKALTNARCTITS